MLGTLRAARADLDRIDRAAVRCTKGTAVLINTARGPAVDEDALVVRLRAGVIAAAGSDVHEREPELRGWSGAHDVRTGDWSSGAAMDLGVCRI